MTRFRFERTAHRQQARAPIRQLFEAVHDYALQGRRSRHLELGSGPRARQDLKVHTRNVNYKGYTSHASKDSPQYEIKSDKTDHIAMHKGTALKRVRR